MCKSIPLFNNGFLIQFGSAAADRTVYFPVAFSKSATIVLGMVGTNGNPGHHIMNMSNSSFWSGNSQGWNYFWVAVGL